MIQHNGATMTASQVMKIALAGLLAFTGPTLAQQPPQSSPTEEACNQRVSMEVSGSMRAMAAIVDLQRQLAAAQARLKELEAAAPKKD